MNIKIKRIDYQRLSTLYFHPIGRAASPCIGLTAPQEILMPANIDRLQQELESFVAALANQGAQYAILARL